MTADLLLGTDWLRPVHHAPGYVFGAAAPAESTVTGVLARQAAAMPDAPFLTGLDDAPRRVLRYAEAHAEVSRRVGVLRGWGLQRGDRIGVLALERFLEVGNGVLDRAPLGLPDFRTVLGQRLLG